MSETPGMRVIPGEVPHNTLFEPLFNQPAKGAPGPSEGESAGIVDAKSMWNFLFRAMADPKGFAAGFGAKIPDSHLSLELLRGDPDVWGGLDENGRVLHQIHVTDPWKINISSYRNHNAAMVYNALFAANVSWRDALSHLGGDWALAGLRGTPTTKNRQQPSGEPNGALGMGEVAARTDQNFRRKGGGNTVSYSLVRQEALEVVAVFVETTGERPIDPWEQRTGKTHAAGHQFARTEGLLRALPRARQVLRTAGIAILKATQADLKRYDERYAVKVAAPPPFKAPGEEEDPGVPNGTPDRTAP